MKVMSLLVAEFGSIVSSVGSPRAAKLSIGTECTVYGRMAPNMASMVTLKNETFILLGGGDIIYSKLV